ncbi:hypothetical protein V5799_010186 [Amblyomma americanum]|uniref:Secreted protein n=1 Tax=Amblyomma americanum TaxID=6943 RepID=A0AAQ4F9Y7_AMBAM
MAFSPVILWVSLLTLHLVLTFAEQQNEASMEDSDESENSSGYEYYDEEENVTERIIKPICLDVIQRRNITVTNATYGNNETLYHSQFMGNWTAHSKCLMPCNPLHPTPCTRLEDGQCRCIPRNDCPTVGVCAMVNVPLGNDDYNINATHP